MVEEKEDGMSKIITITVEGGVIQDIRGIPKDVRVKVLDFDTEGVVEKEITKLKNGEKAVVSMWGGKKGRR